MNPKVEKLFRKEIVQDDLSFDSTFYTELLFTISEQLKIYEDKFYKDKPEEIRLMEKEVQTSALGKFSLTDEQQKKYNEYTQKRKENDPIFEMRAYAEDFLDAIKYLRAVLARQYEKLMNQQSGEDLIQLILQKKHTGDELDPFLLLVTRTNSLKEFIEEYIAHFKKISSLISNGQIFRRDFMNVYNRDFQPDEKKDLFFLYAKLFDFALEFYRKNQYDQVNISPESIMKEITANREFIQNNQTSLNKIVKPQYVALEHSKLVAVTKQIMDSNDPVKAIRVDNKGTTVETSITTDENYQGLRIDSFDTLVEEAIGTLLDVNAKTFEKNGYIDVPLSSIAQQVLILNPNAHISKEQGNSITESMNKLRHIFVKVDFRAQAIAHKKLKLDIKEATIEDTALNYTKTTVTYKGNAIEVYRIHSYPPRYKYSKAIKQISGISRELLYLPNMNITKGVAILRRYMAEYIEGIRNSNLSKTIFFDTINKACDGYFAYETKEAKRDFRNKVKTMLSDFQRNGFIEGFSIVSEGRILKGVCIDVGTAKLKSGGNS